MNYLTEIAVKTIQECAYALGDEFLLNTPLCDVLDMKIGDIDYHPHYFGILKQLPSADVSEKLLNMTIAAYIFPEFDNKLFDIFGFRLNIRIVNAVYDIREDFDVCFILYEIFCKMSKIDSEQSPFLSVNMYLTNRLFMYLNGKEYAEEKNKEQYGIVLREFNFNIEDLKVSQKIKDTLSEIYNFRKYENTVYNEWNLKKIYPYGRGVTALFFGASGTGKTMAVHILSKQMNMPVYQVNLSQVSDKFIGETEKHLERIFDIAEENHYVLLFDEADAVFGKRSEITDAKDKYANSAVSYILQRLEIFNGVCFMTTNIKGNIDKAFMRRIKFVIEFDMPDKTTRKDIWESAFTPEIPVSNIDFEFLADTFEISGSNIKNIVLESAFFSASENVPLDMSHILKSIKNEFVKINKNVIKENFGKYSHLLK